MRRRSVSVVPSGHDHSNRCRSEPFASTTEPRRFAFGRASALARSRPSGESADGAAVEMTRSFAPSTFNDAQHRDVGVLVAGDVQLVNDREGAVEALQRVGLAWPHSHPPGGAARPRIGPEVQLAPGRVQAVVAEAVGEGDSGLIRDRSLLAGRGGEVDPRVRRLDQVPERVGGQQRRLPVASRQQDDDLLDVGAEGAADPPLERLQVEPDAVGEGREAAEAAHAR